MTRALLLAALLASLSLVGCTDYGFVPPSLIEGPRLLAVRATPPEAAPGVDITLDAITARPNDEALTFEWSADLSPRALAASSGQTIGQPSPGQVILGTGASVTLPGADTDAAIDALLDEVRDAEPATPEHVVLTVYREVGLVLEVQVIVRDARGEILVEGFKRVNLTPRDRTGTNPPAPRFRVGERWVSAREGDASRCVAEGDPPEVARGQAVVLAPDDDAAWLETYPALDLDGRTITGVENAYYSWFSTAGDFQFDVTRAPERELTWTAPDVEGDVPLWLVVRDGHLGTSACRAVVRVLP